MSLINVQPMEWDIDMASWVDKLVYQADQYEYRCSQQNCLACEDEYDQVENFNTEDAGEESTESIIL